MNTFKKVTTCVAASLLMLASSSVFAESGGAGNGSAGNGSTGNGSAGNGSAGSGSAGSGSAGAGAAGGISIGTAVALGVLGITLVVESDDDGPSAPTIDRPEPAGPISTSTTGTISTSGT